MSPPASGPQTSDVELMVNISEAKGRLSELIARVEDGERVTLARGGNPVVDLVPHKGARRVLGLLRHMIPDFDEDEFVRQLEAPYTDEELDEFEGDLDKELEGL